MEEVDKSWTTFDSRVSLACDVGQPPRARCDSKKHVQIWLSFRDLCEKVDDTL